MMEYVDLNLMITENENAIPSHPCHHLYDHQNSTTTNTNSTPIYTNLFDSIQVIFNDETSNATTINASHQNSNQIHLQQSTSTTNTTLENFDKQRNASDSGKRKRPPNKKREKTNSNAINMNVVEQNRKKKVQEHNQRVHRYCPSSLTLNLKCEWNKCECDDFDDMDKFLEHLVGEHLSNNNDETNSDTDQEQARDEYEEGSFSCLWNECQCENDFKTRSELKRHILFHAFHTKLKQIGQTVLDSLNSNNDREKEFYEENEENSGNQKEVNDGEKIKQLNMIRCNLDEQTRNVIPELPFKFECSWVQGVKCSYSTNNPEMFYRHIRDAHLCQVKARDFVAVTTKCAWNGCEQMLSNKNRLTEHIRHHSQEKVAACPNCGALFASFTKLIDHCNRSSEVKNLCFQCSHCNKRFATNNLLKEHVRKHINRIKCPQCEMTCIDKNDLNKHILYKHTNKKEFKCTICAYESKSERDMSKHVNLMHNERYEYQCNECEFKTKDINNVKRHMLKFHLTKESSLLLNDGQQFSSSYMCHVCSKVYCQGYSLSRHLKSVHNFEWPLGHSRFRYKLDLDGYYRLQTLRYESVELSEKLMSSMQQIAEQKNLKKDEIHLNNIEIECNDDDEDDEKKEEEEDEEETEEYSNSAFTLSSMISTNTTIVQNKRVNFDTLPFN